MPVIQRFDGYVVRIYFEDHNPPHVHVVGRAFEAVVTIDDAAVLFGDLPVSIRREALDWIANHRTLLIDEWERRH